MKLVCFRLSFLLFLSIYGDNKRPFIYFEVIDLGGEPIKNTDYTWMARVSEFRYGKFLSEVVRKSSGQKLRYLNNFGTGK
jgi:alpha-amylase